MVWLIGSKAAKAPGPWIVGCDGNKEIGRLPALAVAGVALAGTVLKLIGLLEARLASVNNHCVHLYSKMSPAP